MKVIVRDTETTTFDLGTFASRLTYATGWAIRQAAEKVNAELFCSSCELGIRASEVAVKMANSTHLRLGRQKEEKSVPWKEVVTTYIESNGPLTCTGQFTPPRRKVVQQGGNIGHSPTFDLVHKLLK